MTLDDEVRDFDHQLAAIGDLPSRIAAIKHWMHRPGLGRLAFSTSLGLEDQAILHAIHESGVETSGPRRSAIDIFTLDTGRHFPETLDTIALSVERYGLAIRVVAPDATDVETLVARDGINGFRTSIENRKACCDIRKVRPLARALVGASGWITGLRREQSAGRTAIPFVAIDPATGIIKFNPLADWSFPRLEAYIAQHAIPVNPLHARGYPSIGCQPCTRAIRPGEDVRAGRWWWEHDASRASLDGQECGLHSNANRPKPPGLTAVPTASAPETRITP